VLLSIVTRRKLMTLLTYRNTVVLLPPVSATSPAAAVKSQAILPGGTQPEPQATAGAQPWCPARAAAKTNSEGADTHHKCLWQPSAVATHARKEEAGG
jgi:hypothetical protein